MVGRAISGISAVLVLALAAGCGGSEPATDSAATDGAGAGSAAAAGGAVSAEAAACDRDCLIELTDRYLAALVARNPDAVPLASDIAFVENIERLEAEHAAGGEDSEGGEGAEAAGAAGGVPSPAVGRGGARLFSHANTGV